MNKITFAELRALVEAGAVVEVTLEAAGQRFLLKVTTRHAEAVLVATNNRDKPRAFSDPRRAMSILRGIGVRRVVLDCVRWTPEQAE